MDVKDNSWDDIVPLLSTLANLRTALVQCDTELQLCNQVETIPVEYGINNQAESTISKHPFRSSLIGFGRYNDTINNNVSQVLLYLSFCLLTSPSF